MVERIEARRRQPTYSSSSHGAEYRHPQQTPSEKNLKKRTIGVRKVLKERRSSKRSWQLSAGTKVKAVEKEAKAAAKVEKEANIMEAKGISHCRREANKTCCVQIAARRDIHWQSARKKESLSRSALATTAVSQATSQGTVPNPQGSRGGMDRSSLKMEKRPMPRQGELMR